MKKYILITVFVCAAFSSVFAQNYRKPKKGEVVLVFSAEVIPAVNREFFKNYLETPHASWLSFAVSESRGAFTKGEPGDTVSVFFEENKDSDKEGASAPAGDGLISVTVKVAKNKKALYLDYCTYNFFGGNVFRFFFPFFVMITLPEDAQYLYLGHFEYRRKGGAAYEITDVKKTDNYDTAAKIIKERYGDDAELVRAPLSARQ